MAEKRDEIMKRYAVIQQEILKIGWQGILDKYHPDVNCSDENAFDTFKLYKLIYIDMKKKLLVQ